MVVRLKGSTQFTFDGSAAKTVNITPSAIGIAHATAAPKANGTAAVGTSTKAAREDHVHPLQTSVTGNAGTATKLKTARNITLNGGGITGSASFNGSADAVINVSLDPSGHSHSNYLPHSGGNMTGDLGLLKDLNVYTDSTINFSGIGVASGHIYQNENGLNIESIANYSNPGIFFNLDRREENNVHSGGSNRAASEAVVSMMHDGNSGSIVKATKFDGNLTGNAGTATKLASERTISLGGDLTGSVNFDGSKM